MDYWWCWWSGCTTPTVEEKIGVMHPRSIAFSRQVLGRMNPIPAIPAKPTVASFIADKKWWLIGGGGGLVVLLLLLKKKK